MLLAAAFPTLVLEIPNTNGWIKAGSILSGSVYLLYGMLMSWLTLVAYESYRNIDGVELR